MIRGVRAGDRPGPPVRRGARLDRRHDPSHGARHSHRDLWTGQPADSPPGQRVCRGDRDRGRGKDLCGVSSELPRSVAGLRHGRGPAAAPLLEAFPVEQDGERLMALRDPSGFTDQVVVLPMPLLDLVSLFDGEHSIAEMQAILRKRHGEAPTAEQIASLAREPRRATAFSTACGSPRGSQAIEEAFRLSPVRPAVHAGGAYAGEPEARSAAQIDGFFTHADGPGTGRSRIGGAAAGASPLRGLIAPHIDFHRGGPTYAWAYRELIERSRRRPLRHPRHLPRGHGRSVRRHAQAVRHAARPGARRSRLLRRARAALRRRPARLGGRASQRALDRVPGGDAPPSPGRAAPLHDPARARLVPARGRLDPGRSRARSARAPLHRRAPRDHGRVEAAARRA